MTERTEQQIKDQLSEGGCIPEPYELKPEDEGWHTVHQTFIQWRPYPDVSGMIEIHFPGNVDLYFNTGELRRMVNAGDKEKGSPE